MHLLQKMFWKKVPWPLLGVIENYYQIWSKCSLSNISINIMMLLVKLSKNFCFNSIFKIKKNYCKIWNSRKNLRIEFVRNFGYFPYFQKFFFFEIQKISFFLPKIRFHTKIKTHIVEFFRLRKVSRFFKISAVFNF